ncbi:MAG: DNA mismatch repair endonuclease MutL [Candidatus Eremiobacteraeota bacterium]|nr:DNA mismatch repair endonuclease MutL [Candidatus Eremiobacteraeota bacterium]
MPIIRELDAVTIGQIAAGEIIERPASVVKELVENSVDAGATRITVNLERGGLDLIEVVDDGFGIEPSELPLALRRYTTSKLLAAGDLASIATLGFRGEGLASVAAVARTEIVSRTPGGVVGTRVVAHGEEVGIAEPVAAPEGTSVSVVALFENVPVRREYLRTPSAELNRISSWLSSFALAYPDRAFALRHDGKEVWTMPPSASERERLGMVFGRDAASALIPLATDAAGTLGGGLRGYISAPGHDRPDRRMQLLFVNGRLVRSALLSGAWTSGYATFAMIGRHPYGVIFLELPPDHVDPNVHPTKSEVRLRFANQIFDAVRRSIAATLTGRAKETARDHAETFAMPGVSFSPDSLALFDGPVRAEENGGGLRALTQIDRTFLLAADDEALVLIDQHAAHERVAYESIASVARGQASREPLLMPQIVELDAAQSAVLDRSLELLREGGLEIEPFGERTYRIVATPFGYGARRFDLAGFIEDLSEEPKQRDVRERVWASLACHSVTVAGERLEVDEMRTLVQRLQKCDNPMHCPHGRPTMVRLGPQEIARMFKRV